jgi:predicted dinucleotide-binding enzyme
MATIGIIGAGEVGSHIARAAIASGYQVVIANSRGPETLTELVEELGPSARAATAGEAALAGDFVVVAVPLKLTNDMPAAELAGKVVIDANNYMPWRDGQYPVVDRGEKTEHELRQEQLPASKVVKAFTHIQAPRVLSWGRPAGDPERVALTASSDFPEAVEIVRHLYDRFGFDTVDNSPLRESWRTRPGQPAWKQERHTVAELRANLARATRATAG